MRNLESRVEKRRDHENRIRHVSADRRYILRDHGQETWRFIVVSLELFERRRDHESRSRSI